MPKAHHPRRGSIGYSPRKRAKRIFGRIKSWPSEDKVRMQGFAGYKAGCNHLSMVDDRPHSPIKGQEINTMATVIETPPMVVAGIRAYKRTTNGERAVTETWSKNITKDLARVFPFPKKPTQDLREFRKTVKEADDIRLLVHTQPKKSSLPKKKPEVMEYAIGGTNIEEKYGYAKDLLGKEIKISDIFEDGDLVDVVSITKGKGFQSPRKRWGTKLLGRKDRKGKRTAGNLGPFTPGAMMWTVPQSGQMGYHQRTEYNKRILKIGEDGQEVTPKGGFLQYGIIKGGYIIVQGSIPGPRKRMIRLRPAIRPPKRRVEGKPDLTYISTESGQGE
ncbi:MAG: 50S ribosomal protein L3 [Candidatus Hydrothermarchaeales archaeon]